MLSVIRETALVLKGDFSLNSECFVFQVLKDDKEYTLQWKFCVFGISFVLVDEEHFSKYDFKKCMNKYYCLVREKQNDLFIKCNIEHVMYYYNLYNK